MNDNNDSFVTTNSFSLEQLKVVFIIQLLLIS